MVNHLTTWWRWGAMAAVCAALVACTSVPEAPDGTARVVAADTPAETHRGNTFVVPRGWSIARRGAVTVLEAPEKGSRLALVDIESPDAAAAAAAAWKLFDPRMGRPVKLVTPAGPRDGWSQRATLLYDTSPAEHRSVAAYVRRAGGLWTVVLQDMQEDVAEKRLSQVNVVFGRLLPKGYTRETFAGLRAQALGPERLARLTRFVQDALAATRVPGVSIGIVQGGKVVFAGGFGVRALGQPEPVDAQTRYLVASNTKAMVTLMLATLVDEKRFGWDDPVVSVMPSFKLGDAATTAQVRVKHLICACTGLPRKDNEWFFNFATATPETAMRTLAQMQPTSGFGELYQYSNHMAAAAGYFGGQAAYPGIELGLAFDRAMQERVFGPLRMDRTTLDFDLAQQGNTALPHAPGRDGRPVLAEGRANRSIVHVRPTGGTWSTVDDMLKFVSMELADGALPDGRRVVSREGLLARRAPQVRAGVDLTYGMGLQVSTLYGTPLVSHGGSMVGYYSDMMWLPEHGVGAVILTNGQPGWLITRHFRRKLLEVLFEGRPEADEALAADAQAHFQQQQVEWQRVTLPPSAPAVAALAPKYSHPLIGDITVRLDGGRTVFEFGGWSSEMATRENADGSVSFVTVAPGLEFEEFVVGRSGTVRTLTLRDGQNTYVLEERPAR